MARPLKVKDIRSFMFYYYQQTFEHAGGFDEMPLTGQDNRDIFYSGIDLFQLYWFHLVLR